MRVSLGGDDGVGVGVWGGGEYGVREDVVEGVEWRRGGDGIVRPRGDGSGSRWVESDHLPDGIPFDGVRVVIGPVGVFGWLGHHDGCDGLVKRLEAVEDGRETPRTHCRGSAERGDESGVLHLKGGQLWSWNGIRWCVGFENGTKNDHRIKRA